MYQILKPKSYITVVKIPISDLEKIEFIMGKQPKEKILSCFKRLEKKPDFIVNGGLFNMSNGKTITTTVDEGQLIIDGYGSHFGLKILKDLFFKFDAFIKGEDIKDYIGASTTLIIDNKINIQKPLDNGFMNYRHPRLSFGSNDEYFFMVIVDGRTKTAKGMTIKELAEFMLSLSCKNTINEDGGGNLQLEQNNNGVMKLINAYTENRAVDNFIGIYLKEITSSKGIYKVTASSLNIRFSPSILSKVVGKYPQNTLVEVIEMKNSFMKTNKGWVSGKYLVKV